MIDKKIQEEITRQVNEALKDMLGDKYIFSKGSIFLDGRNIQTGRTTGTTIATESDQKVGFHGEASVQADAIAEPTGGTTIDAEARTAINEIIAALKDKGIIK